MPRLAAAIAFLTLLVGPGVAPTDAAPSDYAIQIEGGQHVRVFAPALQSALEDGTVTVEAWVMPRQAVWVLGYKEIVSLCNMWWLQFGDWLGPAQLAGTTRHLAGFGTATSGFGAVPVAEWTHVAMTYDRRFTRIYVNGVLAGSHYHPGHPPSAVPTPWTFIGAGTGAWGNVTVLDEVRIWRWARTEKQIAQSMHQVVPATAPGLVAYYRFEKKGQIAVDSGLYGHHGTLGASSTPGADDPTWVAGGAPVQ